MSARQLIRTTFAPSQVLGIGGVLGRSTWQIETDDDGWKLTVTPHFGTDEVRGGCLGAIYDVLYWVPTDFPIFPRAKSWDEGNRLIRARASGTMVHVDDGSFSLSCLQDLTVTHVGAAPDRCRIVFSGNLVPEAALVGWPGVHPDDAAAIVAAVMDLLSERFTA